MSDVLSWGAKVTPAFRDRVRQIAADLGCDASDLMACMAFESGRSFRPDVLNMAGSGAVGLIQFMPAVAKELGTTASALKAMTAVRQLDWVARYFAPWKGRLHDIASIYMAILWPAAVDKPPTYVLFEKADPDHPARFRQNAALDVNHDGKITKQEAASKVQAMKAEGLNPLNAA